MNKEEKAELIEWLEEKYKTNWESDSNLSISRANAYKSTLNKIKELEGDVE